VVEEEAEEGGAEGALRAALQRAVVTMAGYSVRYHWVGIYLADEAGDLRLQAYRGEPTPHEHIPRGQGICGAVAESGAAEIIPDVNADARYLCCSVAVKSEIVVPIRAGTRVAGVIDIDSHEPRAFGEADLKFLEGLAAELGRKIAAQERAAAREEEEEEP
jgi:GAF domain-containing protein